jgi:hypothetical protein
VHTHIPIKGWRGAAGLNELLINKFILKNWVVYWLHWSILLPIHLNTLFLRFFFRLFGRFWLSVFYIGRFRF